jgi:hypothetical protein
MCDIECRIINNLNRHCTLDDAVRCKVTYRL